MIHEGEKLKEIIEQNAVSRKDYAAKLGFTHGYIYKLYQKTTIPYEYKKAACDLAGVNIRDYYPNAKLPKDEEINLLKKIETMDKINELNEKLLVMYEKFNSSQEELFQVKEKLAKYESRDKNGTK